MPAKNAAQDTNYMDLSELNELSELGILSEMNRSLGEPFTLNSLIRQFGDIPQVHTYYTLLQKITSTETPTLDDLIALLKADLYLYPSESKAKALKALEITIKHYEAEGYPSIPYIINDLVYGDHIVIGHPDGSIEISGSRKGKENASGINTQKEKTIPEAEAGDSEEILPIH